MKVGGILANIEDYLFWRLAYYFISEKEYRILQMSKDQKELWLEKREHKKTPIVRLLRYDLDWSNWMQQDVERTSKNGEFIRKQVTRGEYTILNLYVSAYSPVDDYEYRIKKPFVYPDSKKTIVNSMIIDRSNYSDKIPILEELFGGTILLPIGTDSIEELEVEKLKHTTLSTAVNRHKEEKSLFQSGKPLFTYVFMVVQVAVFLLLEMNGGSTNTATLIAFGAKFNPLILEGEWWRFLTPMLLHIGFLHLITNTLSLYYLGSIVERIFGRMRFLVIYLLSGVSGSVASFLFSPSLSAGASGAIFGCFGALLYFGYTQPKLFLRTMGLNVFVLIGINLAFGFTVPGIDNAGHIGGLVGGFLATAIVHFPHKKKWGLQLAAFVIMVAAISGMISYGFQNKAVVLDEPSILMMSQKYIQEEEYTKANELLTDASNEDDLSADYYFLLSFTEIKLGNIDDAEQNLIMATEFNPSYHEAYYNLALVYLELQQIDKAAKQVEKAVQLQPNRQEYVDLYNEIKHMRGTSL